MPIEVNKCRDCGNIEPLPARCCDRCDRCLRDRLAQIEQSLEALADRMRVADENLTHDGRHRDAQFIRYWLSDVRDIIDASEGESDE